MHKIVCLILAPLMIAIECGAQPLEVPEVEFVTDLARVAGCQFLGTVKPPPTTLGSRRQEDFDNYHSALEHVAVRQGATHLYILNRAAGWGGAAAFGAAYSCRN